MKKLLTTLSFFFVAFIVNAQNSNVDSINIKTALKLHGRRVTGISNDSSNARKDSTNLITDWAAKNAIINYIDAHPSGVDTTALNNKIDLKLNIADTANKWQPKGSYLSRAASTIGYGYQIDSNMSIGAFPFNSLGGNYYGSGFTPSLLNISTGLSKYGYRQNAFTITTNETGTGSIYPSQFIITQHRVDSGWEISSVNQGLKMEPLIIGGVVTTYSNPAIAGLDSTLLMVGTYTKNKHIVNINGGVNSNYIKLNPITSNANTEEGDIYYNSSSHAPAFYNGSSWVTIGSGGSGGSGTVDTSGAVKTNDLIDIRAYGALPDGTTDCTSALNTIKSNYTNPVVWLKNRGAGLYYFNSTDTGLFNNVTLYVEPGAMIVTSDNKNHITVLTPTQVKVNNLGNCIYTIYPIAQNPTQNSLSMDPLRENFVIRESLQPSSFTQRCVIWPNDGITTYNGLIASDSATINVSTSSGKNVNAACVVPYAGSTVTFTLANSVGTAANALIYVETSAGYALFQDWSGGISYEQKLTGQSYVITNYTDPMYGTSGYLNYQVNKAVISIHVFEDGKKFEILFNGVNRFNQTFTVGNQPLLYVGLGAYTSSATVYNSVIEYGRKPNPGNDATVQIFGDSQTADDWSINWIKYFTQYVNASYGIRLRSIQNYAVSGQAIASQYSIFTGVTHKGTTIVQVGTNDIQGQTNTATFISTLNNMVTAVGKNNIIVCVPPMYFSQSLNGGIGQPSSNYDLGALLRSKIIRYCSDSSIMCVDLMQALGATTQESGIMRDDIHPSDYGASMIGREIAKKYLTLITGTSNSITLVGNNANSTINYIKLSTAPANTSTPVGWISKWVNGKEYKEPVYQ